MQQRILVVEDSPTQAAALQALLVGEGYSVHVATSGEDGLREVATHRFDVVISDVVMPGAVDGYGLCAEIKSGAHRDTPVVLLTSLADPLDIIKGLECGADNFLTKPYESVHLLDRVKTLLNTRASRSATKLRMGVEVLFMGRQFTITSEREQILDLLISTFEDAVRQNRELRAREAELESAREDLARYAGSLQARLQHVMASTPAVIYAVRVDKTDFIPTWFSENITRLTGFSMDEVLEPSWWASHLHPEDRTHGLRGVEVFAHTDQSVLEYRFQSRDGTYRWVRDQARLVRDSLGEPLEMIGAWVDITDERRLAEQVRLAQKMEAVGTLAGGVAHDFNNVLAIIKGTVDLALTAENLNPEVTEGLTEIADAVGRASALTRQLLAFGRRQVLEPYSLDLNGLVDDTMKMLARIMGEDIRLTQHLTPTALTIHADPGQIEQVLMNLAVNARDAMPQGGEVTIVTEEVTLDADFCETHPWARPGVYARLTVSDTGSGMDAATQARVFEPFFTTKQLGRGTGLGLAVVYGIVKQHGGLIHLYSEPGKGTAFRVYLPHGAAGVARVTVEPIQEMQGGTETILLAEDDPSLRVTTTRLLERLGYRVIPVATGEEALEILSRRDSPIQVALVDVVMPGMGARGVYEQLQRDGNLLPFIFTTGYSPDTSQTEAIQTLPAAVLSKPYSIQMLARTVRRALDGSDQPG